MIPRGLVQEPSLTGCSNDTQSDKLGKYNDRRSVDGSGEERRGHRKVAVTAGRERKADSGERPKDSEESSSGIRRGIVRILGLVEDLRRRREGTSGS